jgi:hypothetical protein
VMINPESFVTWYTFDSSVGIQTTKWKAINRGSIPGRAKFFPMRLHRL